MSMPAIHGYSSPPPEPLSCHLHGGHLSTGDRLWSCFPWLRPLATITHETLERFPGREVPILAHSMNPVGARAMVRKLEAAGFNVTRIFMTDPGRTEWLDWLDLVREN